MKELAITVCILLEAMLCYSQKQTSSFNPDVAATFDKLIKKPFAELELEDTSGNILNTATLIGKTIYVDFWFTACAPCIKEIPFSKSLQQFFASDTNIVFLNICIESTDRKQTWKQIIKDKQMKGIQVFYARNRPQKVNLLREYNITFPTYLLVDNQMKVIGYNAPRPSEVGFVYWAIKQATAGQPLSVAYRQMIERSKEYIDFINNNWSYITTAAKISM